MPTMADIAQKAGVSVMTVSRIITGKGPVKDSTRKRVLRAMEELHYVPKGLTPRGIQQQINTLVLVVPDITNPFFTFVARGMEDVARKHQYRVFLTNTDEDLLKERESIQMCLDFHADGVLICPVGDSSADSLGLLTQQKLPFVMVDREVQGISVDVVKGNVKDASSSLVSHLIELGHHHIGIVTGPQQNQASRDRLAGYEEAIRAQGWKINPALIQESSMMRNADGKFIDKFLSLSPSPTALFVANVFQYAYARQRLAQRGLHMPQDLSIVGFGNTDELASGDSFLTAAIQPAYSYGSLGTQMLIERIEGMQQLPRKIILEAHLTYRQSTMPPKVGVR